MFEFTHDQRFKISEDLRLIQTISDLFQIHPYHAMLLLKYVADGHDFIESYDLFVAPLEMGDKNDAK